MSTGHEVPLTALLQEANAGDAAANDAIFELVYDELRHLARQVRRNRAAYTLNTTALVHEAYLKLLPGVAPTWHNRLHFFRIAARAMRQVLVNAARYRMASKRSVPGVTVPFNDEVHGTPALADEVLALDEALQQLEVLNERQARVVECRFFAGLTIAETAQALDVSPMTVKRDWQVARAWLARELKRS